mmetsp:Transcript_17180/g.25773  ORF Transcript_17180/g.25773 Transcript_17180/m.25773 type:complete len:135 (+) Transcript_17180:118-522(+)
MDQTELRKIKNELKEYKKKSHWWNNFDNRRAVIKLVQRLYPEFRFPAVQEKDWRKKIIAKAKLLDEQKVFGQGESKESAMKKRRLINQIKECMGQVGTASLKQFNAESLYIHLIIYACEFIDLALKVYLNAEAL